MADRAVVAVVPMKPLALAKSRLATALPDDQRRAVSIAMLARAIAAARNARVSQVWVVGGDDAVRTTVEQLGVDWCEDHAAGLNGAVSMAFGLAHDRGLAPLYLPADLPLITFEDVASLLALLQDDRLVVMAPAVQDGGTNALLLPRGCRLEPRLGDNSFRQHVAQAEALGLAVVECRSPGLVRDLDTPEDLAALEKASPGTLRQMWREGAELGWKEPRQVGAVRAGEGPAGGADR